LNLPLFIAKRYLISKKSHNAINIISAVSVFGVCIGTMALIIVLSAFNGLSKLVESLYNSFDPDIEISLSHGKAFDPNTSELQSLKQLKGVIYFTEVMEENVLLKYNDQQCLATLKGVGENFIRMSHVDTLVKEGQCVLTEGTQHYAVIGKGISYLLNAKINDPFSPLSIYAPKRGISTSINPEDAFNKKNVSVSGIFSINDDFDYKYVILPIDLTRELLDYKTEVSAIDLTLEKGVDQEKILEQVKQQLGDKYQVKNRYQQNELLFKTLKSEKLWTFLILVFILIIATFNVIGSLSMLIIEKKKDITTLWYLGADIGLVRKIFLIEGLLITFAGAALGLILGTLTCWIQIHFKLIRFNEGYVVNAYPVDMQFIDFVWILIVVMLIGFFAAWYPVRIFTRRHLKLN